jgi:hypothetical protein
MLLIPLFVLFVKIPYTYNVAALVGDAAEAYTKRFETHLFIVIAVVQPIMLVAVKNRMHAQAACKFVYCLEAVRMAAWGFVGYQYVRTLTDKPEIFVREYRAAMLARPLVAVCLDRRAIILASLKGGKGFVLYFAGWIPYLATKHTAKASNACACDLNYAAMQVAVGQRR